MIAVSSIDAGDTGDGESLSDDGPEASPAMHARSFVCV